jgi:hypothetical protein
MEHSLAMLADTNRSRILASHKFQNIDLILSDICSNIAHTRPKSTKKGNLTLKTSIPTLKDFSDTSEIACTL